MTLYLYYLIIVAPDGGRLVPDFFKNWLLNAWKCTQMTLYLFFLIKRAPNGGWLVPEFLKFGF